MVHRIGTLSLHDLCRVRIGLKTAPTDVPRQNISDGRAYVQLRYFFVFLRFL